MSAELLHLPEEDREYIEELIGKEASKFYINSDRKAEWAVNKMREEMEERDRLVRLAEEQIAELKERVRVFNDRAEKNTAFFKHHLRLYFDSVRNKRRTKTTEQYELTRAKLVLKKQAPEYVRDEPAMVAWAKGFAPEFVQVKESIAWGELKKVTETQGEQVILKETGEVVPGIVAKAREDVFEVVL